MKNNFFFRTVGVSSDVIKRVNAQVPGGGGIVQNSGEAEKLRYFSNLPFRILRFFSRKLSADFSKLRVTIRLIEENSFFERKRAKKHALFPLNIV